MINSFIIKVNFVALFSIKEYIKTGAEVCQAQTQVCLPAEAVLILRVEFQIYTLFDETYNCNQIYLGISSY